ncbi:MAG TPA: DUF4136 domain-containing protein [Sphingomicrobium sp.]|jgi:hypothetical protein
MRISKLASAAMLGVAALGLSACAQTLNTTVSRYQAMPAPQGQTFYITPGSGMAANGGLEFQRYAGIVAQQLQARGYTPAANAQSANMVVQFGYNVGPGQVRVVSDPFYYDRYRFGGFGYSPFSRGYYNPFYPRFGYGSPYYMGWNDPFWYGRGVDSYVEYQSQVDLHIRAAGTNQPLFDGRAQARSITGRPDVVVPSLVDALFTGFPGRSGETVRITIPARAPGR